MFSQVDEGNSFVIMDDRIPLNKQCVCSGWGRSYRIPNGQSRVSEGWQFCVRMEGHKYSPAGFTSKDLKEETQSTLPSKVVLSNSLHLNQPFAWWVPFTLRSETDHCCSQHRFLQERSTSFGIELQHQSSSAQD
jgi:hypothetical protein